MSYKEAAKLRKGALIHVTRWWLGGPYLYTKEGLLHMSGVVKIVNPAYGCGAQRADKLRAAGDLHMDFTIRAAARDAPKNLPPWDHVTQLCDLFRSEGETRPLGTAKADHADA